MSSVYWVLFDKSDNTYLAEKFEPTPERKWPRWTSKRKEARRFDTLEEARAENGDRKGHRGDLRIRRVGPKKAPEGTYWVLFDTNDETYYMGKPSHPAGEWWDKRRSKALKFTSRENADLVHVVSYGRAPEFMVRRFGRKTSVLYVIKSPRNTYVSAFNMSFQGDHIHYSFRDKAIVLSTREEAEALLRFIQRQSGRGEDVRVVGVKP